MSEGKETESRITTNTKKKIAIAVALGVVLFSGGLGVHLLHSPEKNESKEIEYTTISSEKSLENPSIRNADKATKRSKTKVVEKNQVDRKKESKSKENNSQSTLFDSIFSRIDESNEEPDQAKEALTQTQPLLTLPELKEIAKVTEEKEKQKELLKSKQKENAELVLVGKEGEETEKDEGVEPTPLSTPTPILDPSLEPEPTLILPVESKPKIVVSQSYFELNEGDSFDVSNYYSVFDSMDQSPSVWIENNTLSVGTNTMTIHAVNKFGYSDTATITVQVNGRPKIQAISSNVEVSIHETIDLATYFSATDPEDGNLQEKIEFLSTVNTGIEGEYLVTATVKDSRGVEAEPTTIRFFVKNEAPVIQGESSYTVSIDESFSILNLLSVTDKEDDRDGYPINLTEENILENDLDLTKEGIYTIKIGNVADRDGKKAEDKGITVNVVNEAPVVMASDQTLKIGDSFDPQAFLNSISASDKEDTKNQLTPTISVDEETLYSIRTDIPGVYKIAVTAIDSQGKATTVFATITVVEDDSATTESPETKENELDIPSVEAQSDQIAPEEPLTEKKEHSPLLPTEKHIDSVEEAPEESEETSLEEKQGQGDSAGGSELESGDQVNVQNPSV
ncbi:hypothetical protein BZK37_17560 [Enterococcus casseliflavus]|nr:hypothetical protein BZK37_17560 [Enterococcus casseliflavus]